MSLPIVYGWMADPGWLPVAEKCSTSTAPGELRPEAASLLVLRSATQPDTNVCTVGTKRLVGTLP